MHWAVKMSDGGSVCGTLLVKLHTQTASCLKYGGLLHMRKVEMGKEIGSRLVESLADVYLIWLQPQPVAINP